MIASPYNTSSPSPYSKANSQSGKSQEEQSTSLKMSLSSADTLPKTTSSQQNTNQETSQVETPRLSLSTAPNLNKTVEASGNEPQGISLKSASTAPSASLSLAGTPSQEDTAANVDWQADADYRTNVLGQTWSDQGWLDKNGNLVANQNTTNPDGSINYFYKQYGQDWRNRFANGQIYDYNQGVYKDVEGNQVYRTDILANRSDLSGNAEDGGVSTSGNTNNITKEQYEAAQSADTLWNYFQALGTEMPRWWDRAALYEELTGKPASEYIADADQNTELLRLLQARNKQLSGGAGQGKAGVTEDDVYRLIDEELKKSGLTRQSKKSSKRTTAKKSSSKKATRKSANQQVDKGMSGVAPTATENPRDFGPREKQKPSIRGKKLSREPVLPTGGYIN